MMIGRKLQLAPNDGTHSLGANELATPFLTTNAAPITPSISSTATLTTALALLTHLLSAIGRTPISTITQMRMTTMISSQARLMPGQNATASVPAKTTNTAGAQ